MFGASDYPYTPEQHEEFPTHTVPKQALPASPPHIRRILRCICACLMMGCASCARLCYAMVPQVLPVAASAVVIIYNVPGQFICWTLHRMRAARCVKHLQPVVFAASSAPHALRGDGSLLLLVSSVIQSSAVFHLTGLPAGLRPFIVDLPTVAKIFTGQIKHWRDPEMIRLNPDTHEYLPDANMSVRRTWFLLWNCD